MSDKTYIGNQAAALERGKPYEEISRVIGLLEASDGEMQEVEVGDTTGRTMEVSLQGVTDALYAQQITQEILQSINGYTYRPYRAKDALSNPAVELGDGVTIDGLYSVIAASDEACDELYSTSLGAESFEEIKNEFIFQPSAQRNIERKIAQTRASLRIDIDAIEAEVTSLDGTVANLSISVGNISTEVSGKINGQQAQTLINQTLEDISLSVSGTDGTTTFKLKQGSATLSTTAFDLHVDAVNIEGLLTADQIDTDGLTVGKLGDDYGNYAEMDSDGFYIYTGNSQKCSITASQNVVTFEIGNTVPAYIIKTYAGGSNVVSFQNASQSCAVQLNFSTNRVDIYGSSLYFNNTRLA